MVRHSIKKLLQSSLQAFPQQRCAAGAKNCLLIDFTLLEVLSGASPTKGRTATPIQEYVSFRNASILLLPSSICGLLLFGAGVAAVGAHMFRITSEGSTTAILGQWRPTPLCAEPLQLRDGQKRQLL